MNKYIYDTLDWFFSKTIYDLFELQERLNNLSCSFSNVCLKIIIFPKHKNQEKWINRLIIYLIRIQLYNPEGKYFVFGEYTQFLNFYSFQEEVHKDVKEMRLYKQIKLIFNREQYLNYYTKYREEFILNDYQNIRNRLNNFINKYDEMLINKIPITQKNSTKLIKEYLIGE